MMRIAVGILGLILGLLVMLQSCTVMVGSELIEDAAISEAATAGMGVGLLFLIGGAFAFGLPIVSLVIFVLGALAAFGAYETARDFEDMAVWALAALILAVLSFFARRKPEKPANGATSGTLER